MYFSHFYLLYFVDLMDIRCLEHHCFCVNHDYLYYLYADHELYCYCPNLNQNLMYHHQILFDSHYHNSWSTIKWKCYNRIKWAIIIKTISTILHCMIILFEDVNDVLTFGWRCLERYFQHVNVVKNLVKHKAWQRLCQNGTKALNNWRTMHLYHLDHLFQTWAAFCTSFKGGLNKTLISDSRNLDAKLKYLV